MKIKRKILNSLLGMLLGWNKSEWEFEGTEKEFVTFIHQVFGDEI